MGTQTQPNPSPQVPPAAVPPAPASPPREITPVIRRRSWLQPHARFWWLAAVAFLIPAAYLTSQAFIEHYVQSQLIVHGKRVAAMVGGIPHHERPPGTALDLTFTYAGKHYAVSGVLEGRSRFVEQGKTVPIMIEPANPTHWTYLKVVPPVSPELVAPLISAILMLIAIVMALVERARWLRAYGSGEPWLVRVVGTGSSAIAPLSKQVRCVAAEGRTRQIVHVIVRSALGRSLHAGDLLWVCSSGQRSGRIVALIEYVSPQPLENQVQ